MKSDELVKDTSQPKILIGTIGWISNWWMGSGIPAPWSPAFGAATSNPLQSSSSGTLWPMLPPVLAVISFCIRS